MMSWFKKLLGLELSDMSHATRCRPEYETSAEEQLRHKALLQEEHNHAMRLPGDPALSSRLLARSASLRSAGSK